MAESPSHRFGQMIGETMERAIGPILKTVAGDLDLYLDSKGERKARGAKRKVVWRDAKGNTHELDYVFERGGADERIGAPCAFIEIAWRRYTKHSRNKAQEIQAAILPLAERYHDHRPFLGVVLGGVFTDGSLNQLRSNGFAVLHFPYESIMTAFASVGIDAAFDEDTSDSTLLRKVRAYAKLTAAHKERIAACLRNRHQPDLDAFTSSLRLALTRTILTVYVPPLHGRARTLKNVVDAIRFIESFDESRPDQAFTRYEVGVRFSNGDEIRAQLADKTAAIVFLRGVR
jgi:hypothetical protein